MKLNMPITNKEVRLAVDSMIVSKTDLKGRITYANHDFIEISGFSEQELLGFNHNIVRHPDMPAAAFSDLWQTLKSGRPWVGIVKNRCKNGDHYWVEANVTPIRESSRIVGYMSVRYAPSQEQIEAADRLYRSMNAGEQPASPLWSRILPRSVPFSIRLGLALAIGSVLGGLATLSAYMGQPGLALAWSIVSVLVAAFLGVYLSRTLHIGIASITQRVEAMAQGDYKGSVSLLDTGDPIRRLRDSVKSAQTRLAFDLAESNRLAEQGLLLSNALEKVSTGVLIADHDQTIVYINNAMKNMLGKLEREEGFNASRVAFSQLLGTKLESLYELSDEGGPLGASLNTTYSIQTSLGSQRFAVVGSPVLNGKGYVVGFVTEWRDITEELNKRELEQKILAENTRIKIALDNVSTGVMIADNTREIVYANPSVRRILKQAESEIRKQLPDFNADHLVGANVDSFHKNPANQASLLAQFTSTYSANLSLGSHTMRVIANPVIDDKGERMGSVAEWTDLTSEIQTQVEIARIVDAVGRGDFNLRVDTSCKEGFYLGLSQGLNQFLQTVGDSMNDIQRVLDSLAKGDLTVAMEKNYQGTFGKIKEDFECTVTRLTEIISQIKNATDTLNTASKEIALGNMDLSQRTEKQALTLQTTASTMEELSSTLKQNADNAKQANEMAISASEVASKGGTVVQQVVGTMHDINNSSRKIVDIIGVIDSIAFQTNILALNAAVEAARAGEQGRGFAVVASEVRNLAQRSASAAKEIKGLIHSSVEDVEKGALLVEEAGKTMQQVVTSVNQVTELISEIAAASAEQSVGVEQVNQAIGQIDEVTQQNSALVEQSAAASATMADESRHLAGLVEYFTVQNTLALLPHPRSVTSKDKELV
ncbi:methyl-accepting chemotaxis protein [Methyloterricola oryzae]|uniref:methyl-accepting chemotaxis protein n=1 Tax=Methyloterricola oryzae TaxID=1495050 RepID=UPI0009E3327C|nr:methyl-accepting chemotaxis protein [Methyloterricola oryzae]